MVRRLSVRPYSGKKVAEFRKGKLGEGFVVRRYLLSFPFSFLGGRWFFGAHIFIDYTIGGYIVKPGWPKCYNEGMIFLFTGNGKGKTTSSLGQMMRVLGRGKTALMIQFIKGPWISGEDEFAKKYGIPDDRFAIRKMGRGFVGILGDQLPIEEHKIAAEKRSRCSWRKKIPGSGT